MLPPPLPKKVSVEGKGKQKAYPVGHKGNGASEQNGEKRKAGKRKWDDDDEAYKDRHDLTAERLVQLVNCNIVVYGIILIGQILVRHGHKLSKLMELSLFCTLAITSLYVCAIERLIHSTSRTSLSHLRARTLDMGNFKSGSTLRGFKMRLFVKGSSSSSTRPQGHLKTRTTIPLTVMTAKIINPVIQVVTLMVGAGEERGAALVVRASEEREADSKASQVKKMLVLMSQQPSRYVSLSLMNILTNINMNI